jgi:hypothetical protein
MEFRESEPDYESILKSAGWRIYVERETALHGMKTARRLILRAIKFNDKAKVSATEEFEHGAWRELFEQAAQLDTSLALDDEPPPEDSK